MKKNNKVKLYRFRVPCYYFYEIFANSEKQARKILLNSGGIDIEGKLSLDNNAYKDAELRNIIERN
jgi:hypothetical protein